MEETKASRVKVQALLSVVSGKPIEAGRVHKFSLLDQSMGLHTVHVVFYYKSNPFNDGPMASDLDNLRVSLSHLLDQYPTVTGRLTRDSDGSGWQIKCNDAGVRILQATVNATMDEWLKSADASEERDLTVWEDMPQDPSFWSPFRIQINSFKCGGLAIGVSCTHMHADTTSVTMLIKSWTEVHRGQSLTHPPTFHLPSPTPISSSNNSTPSLLAPKEATNKMATITMKFPTASMEKLLSQVQNKCPEATPFDVLVALFWSCIASGQDPPPNGCRRELSICVDMRERGVTPIHLDYFGNALHFSSLYLDIDKLLNDGIGTIAQYVHGHVAGIQGEDFWGHMSQLESLRMEGKGPYRMYGPRLTCFDMEHMVAAADEAALMYSATFKSEERPAHVSYHVGNVEGEGFIIVMPSPEPGMGRTVMLTLPEEQIANLSKDQGIMDLKPYMLISGRK